MPIVRLDLKKFMGRWPKNNPFVRVPSAWEMDEPLDADWIQQLVETGDLQGEMFEPEHRGMPWAWESIEHHRRVAWFVVHGIDMPIEVGTWEDEVTTIEGYHRTAAAIMLGHDTIEVDPGTPTANPHLIEELLA